MLTKLLNTLYINSVSFAVSHLEARQAQARRRRSERNLQKLDDRLLDDIGLQRQEDGSIISSLSLGADSQVQQAESLGSRSTLGEVFVEQAKSRTRRLRHPYLARRRL